MDKPAQYATLLSRPDRPPPDNGGHFFWSSMTSLPSILGISMPQGEFHILELDYRLRILVTDVYGDTIDGPVEIEDTPAVCWSWPKHKFILLSANQLELFGEDSARGEDLIRRLHEVLVPS